MKRVLHFFLSFLLLGIIAVSCQKEEKEFIDETNNETITATSQLTLLLIRTSENNGAIDDIIDGNSCATLVYPVTVIANGQQLVLESEADLQLVQDIFDQFPGDIDTLEIIFPISLILNDFTQLTVSNQEELEALVAACESEGGNNAIGCLDFEYPITFFVYDNNQQQTATVTVNSDLELYIFLQSLDNNDFISLQYPINVILEDGSVVTVNNNGELQQLITECINNTNTDPIDPLEFEQLLTDGVWYITYFFDDLDETDDFNGYEFSFASDNSAQASNGSNTVAGTWLFNGGSAPELELFFGTTTPFDELDEDWDILEATNEIVRLRNLSGDGSIDYLTYERTPSTGGGGSTNTLIVELTTGLWYVNLFDDDGDIETCDYVDFEFTFNLNGTVLATSSTQSVDGFWTVENDNGNLDLILNFDSSGPGNPLGDLDDDWDVIMHTIDHISLMDSDEILEFGRSPAPECSGGGGGSNAQELRNIMQAGTWFVEQFLDAGDDETADFNGYDFTFLSNETVSAFNGSQTVPGIWVVTVISNGLNFEFDMDSPLNGADDSEYKVLQYTDTTVTLVTLNNGMVEDTLKFKKN
jgi:hypothetical protein